ncbi:phospholipase c [Phytophthora cinnamomi]|uniref:phospholipase c n=1 Tax=Phytophthora cinnamomi TaxID=4785 RepID=UPI00355A4E0F|nr:phospholipase c [Phytophthora cinnamomi]
MKAWRRKPRAQSTTAAASPPSLPWLATDADVGITRVAAPLAKNELWRYEISLRFPRTHTRWLVQRSYADFQRFHAALEGAFHQALHARRVHLPKPSRLGWDAFRAQSARAAAADRLRKQLNSYLHKLLEIESVHASDTFRDFVTPRPESSDSEVVDDECADRTRGLGRSSSATSTSTATSSRDSVGGLLDLPLPFPWRVPPPAVAPSRCDELVHFGGVIALTALGGLSVGLTKRSALSGSQKAAAVAAGVAGVALTGPLSAVFALSALGGGVGKYQLNKASYLSVCKSLQAEEGVAIEFVVENAEQFSGPRRAARFGDAVHLYCHKVRKSVRVVAPPDSKRGHAMATGGDSRKTTLRLVSPYGHTGPLRCGSQVFLQLVDGEWAGQLLGINGEFITATKYSPAVFQLGAISDCHDAVACPEAATKPEPKPVEEGSPLVRSSLLRGAIPFKLRVMVYNVWLLPSFVSSFNEKISPWASQRASAIPRCLAPLDVDVVIFCEAFCSTSREKLVCGMKSQGYIYETKVVGDVSLLGSKKAIDGGCFAMSKYPLGRSEELTFGSIASGEDRYADKGIIYFQVRMPVTTSSGSETTQTVHVVGTHLQAWETPVAVATRNCQLMLMREFVDSLGLPKDEPVIFAGDMNVNKHADGAQAPEGEYTAMLDLLGVHEPELHGESPLYSFDPHTNSLAVDGPSSGGITERLDYIMVERSHRQPVAASTEIVQLKATRHWAPSRGVCGEVLVDLSDHYPVVADLRF